MVHPEKWLNVTDRNTGHGYTGTQDAIIVKIAELTAQDGPINLIVTEAEK